MKITIYYDKLTPEQARTLIDILREFEASRETPKVSPMITVDDVPPRRKWTRRKKVKAKRTLKQTVADAVERVKEEEKTLTAPVIKSTMTREQLLAHVKRKVEEDYDAAEAWCDKNGVQSFLVLDDAGLQRAVAELGA